MNKKMMQGFTLVEIMIVVAIIAILAAIAIPNFAKYRKESQNNSCVSTMASIATAAESWLSKPANATKAKEGGKIDLVTDLVGTDGDGYFKTEPKCPTGGTYDITVGDKGEVTVTCGDGHVAETVGS